MAKKRGLDRLRESKGLDLSDLTKGIAPRTKLEDHPEALAEIRQAAEDAKDAATANEAGKAAVKILKALAKAGLASYGIPT